MVQRFFSRFSKFLIVALMFTSQAYAANPNWEISGNAGASIAADSTTGLEGKADQSNTVARLGFVTGYIPNDSHLEPFVSLSTNTVFGSSRQSNYTPSIGLKFNFADTLQNSFALGARIGEAFINNTAGHQYNLFLWAVFVEKRFAISDSIAWVPEVSYFSRSGGSATNTNTDYHLGAYSSVEIVPFQFAILF